MLNTRSITMLHENNNISGVLLLFMSSRLNGILGHIITQALFDKTVFVHRLFIIIHSYSFSFLGVV